MPIPTITVRDVSRWLGGVEPNETAPDLQIGAADEPVQTIVVCGTVNRRVVDAAVTRIRSLVVAAFPLPNSAAAMRWDTPVGSVASRFIPARCSLLVLNDRHVSAPDGLDHCLASALGLQDAVPLVEHHDSLVKFVTFVPEESLMAVQDAAASAGAGAIGNYANCSFRVRGKGTFLPMEGARPAIGEVGKLARVEETRLEMVAPSAAIPAVVAAVKSVHPYEEMAYDLYTLSGELPAGGRGRIGKLPEPIAFDILLQLTRNRCSIPESQPVRWVQTAIGRIRTVAVASGIDPSGALLREAQQRGAGAFLVGGLSSADTLIAGDAPTVAVDIGLDPSVAPGLRGLADRLAARFREARVEVVTITG